VQAPAPQQESGATTPYPTVALVVSCWQDKLHGDIRLEHVVQAPTLQREASASNLPDVVPLLCSNVYDTVSSNLHQQQLGIQ